MTLLAEEFVYHLMKRCKPRKATSKRTDSATGQSSRFKQKGSDVAGERTYPTPSSYLFFGIEFACGAAASAGAGWMPQN